MKRLLKTFLAACLLTSALTFTACGNNTDNSDVVDTEDAEATITDKESEDLEQTVIKIASLKGPTTMGMIKMMDNSDNGEYADASYQVDIYGTADEIVTQLVKGEIDAANVPCNLASVLYGKTEGNVSVAAINTMGVLYMVETGEGISDIQDLRGKKIYNTGKGTTPEYILNYILKQNGIDPEKDVEIEFKSESAEIAALLSNPETAENAVALLPQPYITIAGNSNSDLRVALNMQEEWVKVNPDSNIVTGVTLIRKDFIEENPEAVKTFLSRYKESVDYVNANTDEAAALVAKYDIAPEAVAKKALPLCSISFITGEEMTENIKGYLQVLFDSNPQSIGGTIPDEAFYYAEK